MKYSNQLANLDIRENYHFHFFSHNVKTFLSSLSTILLPIHLLLLITIDPYIPLQVAPSTQKWYHGRSQWCSKSDETAEGNVDTCWTVTKVRPSICLRCHRHSSYQSQPHNRRLCTFFELVYFLTQKMRNFAERLNPHQ